MAITQHISQVSPFFWKKRWKERFNCAINTTTHPYWLENSTHYGDDHFRLSLHAGGTRDPETGGFSGYRAHARIWLYNSVNRIQAYLNYNGSEATTSTGLHRNRGASVLAVRDVTDSEKDWVDGRIKKNAYEDGSGNLYDATKIGEQMWITKYLRTTKFQDGTNINNATTNSDWTNDPTDGNGSYCWYGSSSFWGDFYGGLYNFMTLENGLVSGGGWRVATNLDWTNLINYITANYAAYSHSNIAQALKSCRQQNHPNA